MNPARMADAYPGARELVLWHEQPACVGIWEVVREAGLGPREVLPSLKSSAKIAISAVPQDRLGGFFHQFDHPDFLRYVAAKLGAY